MLKLKSSEIKKWLSVESRTSSAGYRHQLLVEKQSQRSNTASILRQIVREAHGDAKQYLRQCTEAELDPLGASSDPSIADAYPHKLHLSTKKAYFGEIMAGLIAENFASAGPGNWRVLTFLFRLHELAFDQLEMWRETGVPPKHVWGQSGDDCVAFSRDVAGRVNATLVCEGKCTNDHDSSMIAEAHRKLGTQVARPISLSRIIKILKDHSSDPEAVDWADALHQLYRRELRPDYRRFDLVSYTCGRRPAKASSWMTLDRPHDEYKGKRDLESVEIHVVGVDALVEEVYKE